MAAHVVNVRGKADYDRSTGKEANFAFKVSLATSIPPEQCESVALGYRDPSRLEREFQAMRGEKLWIRNGGKMLYALRK